MSTDADNAVKEAQVFLTKCHVETVESGYGGYALSNTLIHSSSTTLDAADDALIMIGGSGVFTDGSVVNSRRIGVMAFHWSPPGFDLVIIWVGEEAANRVKYILLR